ncbi:hypothetical protein LTR67_010211 [Exophiala xenobiotica]
MSPLPSYHIVIVGAGIGGLGAAIALVNKGHQVEVVDGAPELSEIGAGITIPPNASRILIGQYGLREQFEDKVTWPPSINLRRYANGKRIGRTPLLPDVIERYGFPYWLIHRADYQLVLYKAALAAGVLVHLNSRVVSVDESAPSVMLRDGRKLFADLVVGADGIRSVTRDTAFESNNGVGPRPSANCAFRATIPGALMNGDPDLRPLMESQYDCWIGHRRHVMAYPIRHGQMYNVVMSHPGKAEVGKWNEPGNVEEMKDQYKDFEPLVSKFLGLVDKCTKWILAELPPLNDWVSQSGKVVLIGDAAHGMLQYLGQGAAQATEDGATLAECIARASDKSQIPAALRVFERIRRQRCEMIQRASARNGEIWHLPDGEDQEIRDAQMRERTPREGSATTKNSNQWSDPEFQPWLFGHDAVKVANEGLDAWFDPAQETLEGGDGIGSKL